MKSESDQESEEGTAPDLKEQLVNEAIKFNEKLQILVAFDLLSIAGVGLCVLGPSYHKEKYNRSFNETLDLFAWFIFVLLISQSTYAAALENIYSKSSATEASVSACLVCNFAIVIVFTGGFFLSVYAALGIGGWIFYIACLVYLGLKIVQILLFIRLFRNAKRYKQNDIDSLLLASFNSEKFEFDINANLTENV